MARSRRSPASSSSRAPWPPPPCVRAALNQLGQLPPSRGRTPLTNRKTHRSRTLAWPFATVPAASTAFAGCAAFNKGELAFARNVTFGQELIDLKKAHDTGAITDEKHAKIKARIMELVDPADDDGVVNDDLNDHDEH